ncbi:uncharacterized protein LOC107883686 [Acyrthosiphon pisum]|uniref:Uncharacterized protein n=1 Tax=Acyrthosiphon pisum TaxID=7029 RepID=A0A8R2NRV7_ACYPI|nr:uncharacterized protein LOC107883686 [Acyrthosiphon pisum]
MDRRARDYFPFPSLSSRKPYYNYYNTAAVSRRRGKQPVWDTAAAREADNVSSSEYEIEPCISAVQTNNASGLFLLQSCNDGKREPPISPENRFWMVVDGKKNFIVDEIATMHYIIYFTSCGFTIRYIIRTQNYNIAAIPML